MPTIRKEVVKAFRAMPKHFKMPNLCRAVKEELAKYNRYPMDDTITRELRYTRADGITPYKCIDRRLSLYEK